MLRQKCGLKLLVCLLFIIAFNACNRDDDPEIPASLPSKLYWTAIHDPKIVCLTLRNNAAVDRHTLFDATDGLLSPHGIAIDQWNASLYWAEYGNKQIMRGNMNGSGLPVVLFDAADGVTGPVAIAIDDTRNKIYWTEPGKDRILRANTDGSGGIEVLYDAKNKVNGSFGITLSIANGHLYWVEFADNQVMQGNLDGSGMPAVLFDANDGLEEPYDIAIDAAHGKIYIVDNALPGLTISDRILYGRIDGKGPLTTLFDNSHGVDNAYALALDVKGNKIYWMNQLEDGAIMQGNLDGSGKPHSLVENIKLGFAVAIE